MQTYTFSSGKTFQLPNMPLPNPSSLTSTKLHRTTADSFEFSTLMDHGDGPGIAVLFCAILPRHYHASPLRERLKNQPSRT